MLCLDRYETFVPFTLDNDLVNLDILSNILDYGTQMKTSHPILPNFWQILNDTKVAHGSHLAEEMDILGHIGETRLFDVFRGG